MAASKKEPLFTIKTTQKLLRTSGDPAQEMIESQVMELDPPAEEHLMVLEQDQLEALQMETVVMELVQPAEEQVLVTEMVQTVGIPALVLMVVPVQVMELDPPAEEHLMVLEQDQLVVDPQIAMAQLVAQVMVTETVQTVGTPAVVLLTAPEAQATVLV
ncbi:MAG: hypothetical protein CL915_01135, partial [Deltaproteobacteria bacterium]|nr:hypothetical protein [Deltaproteobacteria bacterium]